MKIILAHGVLGFGKINVLGGEVKYFKGVADELQKDPDVKVSQPSVGAIKTVAGRARALSDEIRRFVPGNERGFIIAHSMGGLDARQALQSDDIANRIAAVVMIGTPHLGSPIADLLSPAHAAHLLLKIDPQLLREIESTNALGDLETSAAKAFNAANPDRSDLHVVYHNIAGVGRRASFFSPFHTCALFVGPHAFMAPQGGSDGIVPIKSASREMPPWDEWHVDHAEEVGWDLDNALSGPSEEHLARYREIVERLKKEFRDTAPAYLPK